MNKRYQLEVSRVRNASRHDLVNYNGIIMGVFVLGRRFFTNVFLCVRFNVQSTIVPEIWTPNIKTFPRPSFLFITTQTTTIYYIHLLRWWRTGSSEK